MNFSTILKLLTLFTFYRLQYSNGEPCAFDIRCTCSSSLNPLIEVVCLNVPLLTLPELPTGYYYRVNVIGAEGINYLDYGYFNGRLVSAFTFRKSKLSVIDEEAFTGTETTLTTLDLSNNEIRDFPHESFAKLPLLQWLSLKGNQIADIRTLSFPSALRTLLLSDNLLTSIQEQTFSGLQHLESLDIDGNSITKVDGRPFPSSLTSLSLAHNLLDKMPFDAINNLQSIKWLQLRGNIIRELPNHWSVPVSFIEILDLSHNLISFLSPNFFTSSTMASVTVDVLHLDFNFIKTLVNYTFSTVSIHRLSLSNNKISTIESFTFSGPLEKALKTLDLNFNLLETYPTQALQKLLQITKLFVKGNGMKNIDEKAFENCNNLQELDLSSNIFVKVPSSALRAIKRLLKLNLEDNQIEHITAVDFGRWTSALLSLSLSRNGIRIIEHDAFKHMKSLKALRLSYNNILHASPEVMFPLRQRINTLELSYAINVENQHFLQVLITFLQSVEWLELDHNNVKRLPIEAVRKLMTSLIHLDLEGNQIVESDFLSTNANSKLRNIILAHNKLTVIKSKSFYDLHSIVNIVLLANKIRRIERYAFANCAQLQTIVLTRNAIESIEEKAFCNLTLLNNLFLQENKLITLSIAIFDHISGLLYLNASYNAISELYASESTHETKNETVKPETPTNIRVFDISNNNVSALPEKYMRQLCVRLQSLDISNNNLTSLSENVFEKCTQLVSLSLNTNHISSLPSNMFTPNSNLRILNLANNELNNISIINTTITTLNLSFNRIAFIDENAFKNTSLQKLKIANNDLKTFQFLQTFKTLKYLDLSNNSLNEVPVEIKDCQNLIELSLSNNNIEELKERFLGTKAERLLTLDLSSNSLRKINSKAFLSINQLKSLRMQNAKLTAVPFLPLPQLSTLDVSHNHIVNISSSSVSRMRRLKTLDLSHNNISDIPLYLWKYLPNIIDLNIAYNPVDSLDTTSFEELKRLRSIDIRGLKLKFIDSRSLHGLRHLNAIKTSTFPNVRSFRLHDLLAKSISLKVAFIEVQETTLSHQIQWAFGAKLKELIISGPQLIKILPDAFLGLFRTSDLTLRITGTNVTNLPLGLLRYLADIRFMTIDLRRNKLSTLRQEVLYTSETYRRKHWNTLQIAGGLLLEHNPWSCSCSILWLSSWLRQWIKETRKLQRLNFDALLQLYSIAQRSECHTNNCTSIAMTRYSLIDLYPEDINCTNGISNAVYSMPLIVIVAITVLINKKLN